MAATYPPRATTTGQPHPRLYARKTTVGLLLGLLTSIALGYVVWAYQHARIPIVVEVDGKARLVHTTELDPGVALAGMGFVAGGQDLVSLPANPLTSGARIVVERARPVVVNADGRHYQAWTHAASVKAVLAEAGIPLGWKDRLEIEGTTAQADAVLPDVVWAEAAPGLPRMPWERRPQPVHIAYRPRKALSL